MNRRHALSFDQHRLLRQQQFSIDTARKEHLRKIAAIKNFASLGACGKSIAVLRALVCSLQTLVCPCK